MEYKLHKIKLKIIIRMGKMINKMKILKNMKFNKKSQLFHLLTKEVQKKKNNKCKSI